MEHIVQFAINIDDKAIQKRLKYGNRINWDSFVSDRISRFIEDHKAEIIDAAAEKLTKSIRNSKAFKERKQEVMEDTE